MKVVIGRTIEDDSDLLYSHLFLQVAQARGLFVMVAIAYTAKTCLQMSFHLL